MMERCQDSLLTGSELTLAVRSMVANSSGGDGVKNKKANKKTVRSTADNENTPQA